MQAIETTQIYLPYPNNETTNLHLWFKLGGARFFVHPDEGTNWVSGVYNDPTRSIPCRTSQEGGNVWITQSQNPLDFINLFNGVPGFDLALGRGKPYTLTVESGGSDKHLELGGVPLQRLDLKQGAGKTTLDFAFPNPVAMTMLHLGIGAGKIEAKNLLNSNFQDLNVEGGTGSIELEFGGMMQRDARARVSAGMAAVELRIPAAIPARIYTESTLVSLDIGNGFTRQNDAFFTPAALNQTGTPLLTIYTSIAVGSLRLRLI